MKAYKSSGHCVGESNWHFQFTPAFRREIFNNSLVRELTIGYLIQASQDLGLKVGAIECGRDHIHLFLQDTRKVSVVEAVHKLKGYSSFMMRRGHHYLFRHLLWGNKFWSAGYFYQTVGVITSETIKTYIENGQEKHWITNDKFQKTLLNFRWG